MKNFFAFSIFILLAAFQVQANAISEPEFIRQNYPKLEEVLTYISKEISHNCNECVYGIAKTPEGFFLTIENFENNPSHKKEFIQVWSRNAVDYLPFDVSKYASKQPLYDIPQEFVQLYNLRDYYDFYLYYGYNQWNNDTRALLANESMRSAADLEILARIANSEALAYIRPGMNGDYFDFSASLKDGGYSQVSTIQLQGFQKKTEECLGYWKQIKREYPDYKPLIVDDIQLKIGNEHMHFFQLARSIKDDRLASQFLGDAYYSEAWIQFAKNLLSSCAEDGILFTAGDSDTFPLLFVQEKMGYRSDVTVINTSLLNTGWYWDMIQTKTGIKSVIKAKDHEKLSDKPLYQDRQATVTPFKQWLEKTVEFKDTMTYRLFPKEFVLNYDESNLYLEPKTLVLTVSDLLILDIMSCNPDRPVFTSSPYGMVNIGLYYNLATTGRAFSVVADREAAQESIKTVESVEQLVFQTDLSYLKALGSASAGEVSMLSYLIMNISPIFQERKDALVARVSSNIPTQDLVKSENFALIEAMSAFYEVMDPVTGDVLRKAFQPVAADRILNTSVLNKNFQSNLDDMEMIFSIYAHFRVHEHPEYDIELDEIDRLVLNQLLDKIIQLSENRVLMNQAWVRERLFRFDEAFQLLQLER